MYYGLTCAEFEQLVLRAEGRCERCGDEMRAPDIDHDHQIGRHAVRGLVCHQCNIVIAMIERGQRAEDMLSTAYFANPFHRLIPTVMPGYRPIRVLADLPPIRHDYRLHRTSPKNVVTMAEAADMLGITDAEIRELITAGKLIGVRGRDTCHFRRTVVERHHKSGSE